MPAAAKEEMLASPSAEEIFSLAAGVAAALEMLDAANAARGKKTHQGIFPKNRRLRVRSTWVKWSGTHQDRGLTWSETVLGPTIYLYDGANILEEVDNSGNALARYTQGPGVDQSLAELRSGTTSYYQRDALSSITSLSNSGGTLANTYTYNSYGKLTASTGTITNPFQYTGREFDQETGIYYYRARYYDQSLGRFSSEDPLFFGGGTNFYLYVTNDPMDVVDPFGLKGKRRPALPPPLVPNPNAIDRAYDAYENCHNHNPWKCKKVETPHFPKPPRGGGQTPGAGDFAVAPGEGSVPVPSDAQLALHFDCDCLRENPMAALDRRFNDVDWIVCDEF
jgi:RHS repeat-associated protein